MTSLFLAEKKFWILDPLYGLLGRIITGFYAVIPSYAVAIILLTIVVRILILPLTAKQAKAQQAMQRVQPELKKVQARFKDDRQKMNEEMMKVYREHKVNPFSACLPVLFQAPIFIVLYRLIIDLSDTPPKHIPVGSSIFKALMESGGKMLSFGVDLSRKATDVDAFGSAIPYYLLIAVVVGATYYQQRQITARAPGGAVNPQMKMLTRIMPIMFGFFSFNMPAGVVLYFAVSALWQIGQQHVIFSRRDAADAAEAAETKSQRKKGPVDKTGAIEADASTKGAKNGAKSGAKAPEGKRRGLLSGFTGSPGLTRSPGSAGSKGSARSASAGKAKNQAAKRPAKPVDRTDRRRDGASTGRAQPPGTRSRSSSKARKGPRKGR